MRTLDDHLYVKGRKRILSLDGGGVRGLITLGFLAELERRLADRFVDALERRDKTRADFRLSDYFDLIGGTSTGGIIACLLALGFSVKEIRAIYFDMCPEVFEKRWFRALGLWNLVQPSFDAARFSVIIDQIIALIAKRAGSPPGTRPTLETAPFKTGFAMVTKRIDTNFVVSANEFPLGSHTADSIGNRS